MSYCGYPGPGQLLASRKLLYFSLLPLAACAMHGPDATRVSRLAYNEAVQVSEQHELLLNLVRLRYTESPEFFAVSGISTQLSFEGSASLGGEFGKVEGQHSAFVVPGIGVGYAERPTVTFMPQRGQEFTRQLVTPVELDSLYLVTQYGWGIDRALRLIAQNVNGLSNATTRETLGQGDADSLLRFARAAALLRKLQEQRLLDISRELRPIVLSAPIPADQVSADTLLEAAKAGYRLDYHADPPGYSLAGESAHYVLQLAPGAAESAELSELLDLLRLAPEQSRYELDPAASGLDARAAANGQAFNMLTRSVLGMLAYLSNTVEVPEAHLRGGLVEDTAGMHEPLADLLRVRVAEARPDEAALAVPYRGYWFFVEPGDHESRRTLGLLTALIRLEISAGGAQNVPILTLPVTR